MLNFLYTLVLGTTYDFAVSIVLWWYANSGPHHTGHFETFSFWSFAACVGALKIFGVTHPHVYIL